MLATPSESVTCSFACPASFSASVQPGFALFNCFSSSCLALSLAPSLEPDFSLFSCFSSSCLSLALAPSLKPFLVALPLNYPFRISMDHKYRIAGNFRGVQFSRKGKLQAFRGLIFADGRSRTAPPTIPG